MPKIILTNYSYQNHDVGDIVDLGEIQNSSLVGMGRAVWYEPSSGHSTPKVKKPIESKVAISPKKKKLIANSLQEKVQEAKKEPVEEVVVEASVQEPKKSFWDKLK